MLSTFVAAVGRHSLGRAMSSLPGLLQELKDQIDNVEINTGNILSSIHIDGDRLTSTPLNLDYIINRVTILPSGASNQYTVADGVEGQVLYIVPFVPSGDAINEYTSFAFEHYRSNNSVGNIWEGSGDWWLPFRTNLSTLVLTFTDGHCNLPHGNFD
jgi:hypothetical protein